MTNRLMKATSVKLQTTIDRLTVLHDRMREDSYEIARLLKEASDFGYDVKIMSHLNDLHYEPNTQVRREADKYLQSRMYKTPAMELPGGKPNLVLPG